ncbi:MULTISPECIES: hypothetical protein [unclassified Ketobacter]|uniref:hypothetical protein n=1 Tax=unclassified Ketobacter TaxID=2639109 RepID=UPI000F0E6F5F|nr:MULTISPECIES: hypothetical protein [unclassified Ketobacter]RLT91618.1 MAG: hypothetical protein D9N13_04605 [Ketobacter sp. GenoA1]RLT96102.1 MAG: hypothetical protein D9N15_11615 [Ketobacter sp.]
MKEQHHSFEALKQKSESGQEYWSARDLAPILEYRDWRNFGKVIRKAMQACEASDHAVSDHFVEATKMVPLGSGSQRELAANLFRATQAEEKLRRDNIQNKGHANQTHFDVGQKVRQTIEDLGGTKPEDLPTPDKSIKQLETATKKLGKKDKQESKE